MIGFKEIRCNINATLFGITTVHHEYKFQNTSELEQKKTNSEKHFFIFDLEGLFLNLPTSSTSYFKYNTQYVEFTKHNIFFLLSFYILYTFF